MPLPPDREAYWRKQLGRLHLGAEPIEHQLARQRRALLAMSGILVGLGSIFLGLFASFGRIDVGGVVAGLIVLPVGAWAWIDYTRLCRKASFYRREMAEGDRSARTPSSSGQEE